MKRLLLAFGLVALSTPTSFAASYTWNNTAGNWSDANRWIPNSVPGPNDEANINGGQVMNNSSSRVISALNFNGGELQNSGFLTVQSSMNWTSGTLSGGGRTVIASGATLNV